MYDIEVLPSVTDIPKEAWDALAPPDDPLWRWSYFKIMESSGIGPDGFEYIVFRRGRRIAAILPAFWFDAYPLSLGLGVKLDKAVAVLRRLVPGLLRLPVYFCGHPMGEGKFLRAGNESFSIDPRILQTVQAKLELERLTPVYFASLSAARDIDKKFVVCFDGDRLIGFVLCLFAGEGAVCFRGGFDYRMSRESGCYFVLQYECIRLAISAGCREMNFCQTTYLPKLALGCYLVPFKNIVTHKNGFLRPIVRYLLPMLFRRYSKICGLDKASAGAPRDRTAAAGAISS